MNTQVMDLFHRAEQFNIDTVLYRYMGKFNVDEKEAREQERELKKFLTLCAYHPEQRYGMGEPLDSLWHEFILSTKEYVSFCGSVNGGYIHHKSRDQGISTSPEEFRQMRLQFKLQYENAFGHSPPSRYWDVEFECSHGNCGSGPDDRSACMAITI